MYLSTYISLYNAEGLPLEIKNPCGIIKLTNNDTIKKELAYWRKANHIHKWFVDNCNGGNDDCGEYFVDVAKLRDLYDLCCEVLENKNFAEKLLPVTTGCFFGSYEYDDYYYQQTEYTKNVIEEILNDNNIHYVYYHASW